MNLRVAFISPRVFGTMGTQGSYGMAKAFCNFASTMVISQENVTPDVLPIVAKDQCLENHCVVDFSKMTAKEEVASLICEFNPDIIHFVNDRRWVNFIPFLKDKIPNARFVIDFKTPVLSMGPKRLALQEAGIKQSKCIDLVVALGVEIADSWIPGYKGPLLIYPLGVELSKFQSSRKFNSLSRSKIKFVYIGQTHSKRKLSRLLEFISCLEMSVRNYFSLDIFGAGGGEDEIDAQILKLNISDIVVRHAALPQDLLFSELQNYDCGIAWVPRELYDAAPSLKFLEYAAAKIGIIASDTLGHRRNVDEGFSAFLFEENFTSFSNAVQRVISGGMDKISIEKNYEKVQCNDFDFIVQKILLPEYKILAAKTNFFRKDFVKRRLLFITTRPLGTIATPGTYLGIEAYSKICNIQVIAKRHNVDDEVIVHKLSDYIPVIFLDPKEANYQAEVKSVILDFQPDMVLIGVWPDWHILASGLREEFSDLFIALEIKCPVQIKNAERLESYKALWQSKHLVLDAIIAPSKMMVDTYIDKNERPFLQHKSCIDFSAIKKKKFIEDKIFCKKFIFAGSLSSLRSIDKFLNLLLKLPREILSIIQVDMFGDGPSRLNLESFAKKAGLGGVVRFMGVIPQKELYQRYSDYDAGFAWVPRSRFDSAPSLKLIEYCASGIVPIATSTRGHLMQGECGFFVKFFEEDVSQSFVDAVVSLCAKGVSTKKLVNNIKNAEDFDYNYVINNEIFPFYQNILNSKNYNFNDPANSSLISNNFLNDNYVEMWKKRLARDIDIETLLLKQKNSLIYERFLHAQRMKKNE